MSEKREKRNVRLSLCAPLVFVLAIPMVAGAPSARAEEVADEYHPWARCGRGAWKLVHVVTKTFDKHGAVAQQSSSETKTSLEEMDSKGVTLKVSTVLDVGGNRFRFEPQVIKQGIRGEPVGDNLKITQIGTANLTIEGRTISCQVEQVQSASPTSRTTTKIYYSDTFLAAVSCAAKALRLTPKARPRLARPSLRSSR